MATTRVYLVDAALGGDASLRICYYDEQSVPAELIGRTPPNASIPLHESSPPILFRNETLFSRDFLPVSNE